LKRLKNAPTRARPSDRRAYCIKPSARFEVALVNGVPVIADGKMTDALPGKVVRGAGDRAMARR
jgi:hypothetical protein